MASNITYFLVSLVDDPQKLDNLKQNPDAVMDAGGLTPAEKALLLSGNMPLIRAALVADPDHKAAMGIATEHSLPARLPLMVYP